MALKDVPQMFNVDTEEDVRIAVVKYFQELGFELDEIRTETRFTIQLGHNTLVIEGHEFSHRDRVTGRSDILLTRNGRPLAIVETKSPGHSLNEKDALQALSYARLLLEMAPYAIVTNGRDTRVYDTFAPTLTTLETPTESLWAKNGQQVPSIGNDLRIEAAKKLIEVNPQTLRIFCHKQLAQAMEDIKGSPHEAKMYIPDVYVPRQNVEDTFNDWLASDMPCFAIVAESGLGKTNFMCATAEKLVAEHFVLFYPAVRLIEDLKTAICNDFSWEFHRERGLAYIVERFAAIAREHNRKFVIFIDGIDEFIGNHQQLKNELLDLVHRLRETPIRLCLSCKSFDWSNFVIDNGRSFNRLATSVYPPQQLKGSNQLQAIYSPDPHNIGVWLQEYTDDELEATFSKYKQVFSLQGQLQGTTRSECRMPLILRLLADVWKGRNRNIPSEISQREVFDWYWTLQMSKVRQKFAAERWLATVARLSVESGDRQVAQSVLFEELAPTDVQDEIYHDLVRCGLLRVTQDKHGNRTLAFGQEKMRSYVYTLKARAWPAQATKDVARTICDLLTSPVGFETVDFYLRVIDRGETRLLTDVGLYNIHLFAELLGAVKLKSSVLTSSSGEEQQDALISHLEQYVTAYSKLSRHYFPEQSEKLEPYMKGEVGLWISGSMYQLRVRTQAYPQPILILPQELAGVLWNRAAPPEVYSDLKPGGDIHLDLGMSTLVDDLPQKMAWNRILSQIARLFVNRCLDETDSPELLQERAWYILREEPSGFWGGVPITGKYWEVLGFQSIEEVQTVSINELMLQTHNQIQRYMGELVRLIQQYSTETPEIRWYVIHIRLLRRLYYALRWLSTRYHHLELPAYTTHDFFDYLRTGDLTPVVKRIEQLLPSIMRAYISLVRQNFSHLADQLSFFRYADASMLVEVTREPSLPPLRSDFLRVAYVLLPSTRLAKKYLVYRCDEKDSIVHVPFTQTTLQGWTTRTSGMQGAKFGQAALSHTIGDIRIEEPSAFFCFTQFPSHHPILDQTYQLLGNELQYLLEGDFRDWHQVESGNIKNEQLDMWIDRQASDLGLSS
jgi:hypothetical protein